MEVNLSHIYILMISFCCGYFKGSDRIVWAVVTTVLLGLNGIIE